MLFLLTVKHIMSLKWTVGIPTVVLWDWQHPWQVRFPTQHSRLRDLALLQLQLQLGSDSLAWELYMPRDGQKNKKIT